MLVETKVKKAMKQHMEEIKHNKPKTLFFLFRKTIVKHTIESGKNVVPEICPLARKHHTA